MSTATKRRLTKLNEFYSRPYEKQQKIRLHSADNLGISQDSYSLQMAALIPQMRLGMIIPTRESCDQENQRFLAKRVPK